MNRKGEAERLKIIRAKAGSGDVHAPAGTVTTAINVATADGELEIKQLELSDGRVIGWQDFVRQRQVSAQDGHKGPGSIPPS